MTITRDIKRGKEIGHLDNSRYIWYACPDCGKERWIRLSRSKVNPVCRKCKDRRQSLLFSHDKSRFWKGGKIRKAVGTVMIKLKTDDFFYSMVDKAGYVLEHRLVMAKHLGRCLQSWEVVHHKNGIKDDNRLENLDIISCNGEHMKMHNQGYQDGYRKGYYDAKDNRIKELLVRIQELEQTGQSSKG